MANDKRENTRCLGSLLIGNYSVSTVTIYMVHYFIIIIIKKNHCTYNKPAQIK